MSYDAWGSRHDAANDPVSATSVQVTEKTDDRGCTGQEMLDPLELVHLNGRVYDPLMGRFISADPHVTDPMNGQNYNRYSYVLNNPTNLEDPTGFDDERIESTGHHILGSNVVCRGAEACGAFVDQLKQAFKGTSRNLTFNESKEV